MFCSKCGKEVLSDTRFCPQCGNVIAQDVGTPYVQSNFIQPLSSVELPSHEHLKAFQKWFGIGSVSVFIGCVAGFIGCCAAFILNGRYFEGTQYSSALSVFLILSILGLIIGIVLTAMALNIRLKPQPSRTLLRYGIRFIEFALSFTNLGLIASLVICFVFGGMIGNDDIIAEAMGAIIVSYIGVVEILVGMVRKKYKSDENYGDDKKTRVINNKKSDKITVNDKTAPTVIAASEKDMAKCQNALSKFEEINSDSKYNVPTWKCKHCGCENPNTSDECKSCGRYK